MQLILSSRRVERLSGKLIEQGPQTRIYKISEMQCEHLNNNIKGWNVFCCCCVHITLRCWCASEGSSHVHTQTPFSGIKYVIVPQGVNQVYDLRLALCTTKMSSIASRLAGPIKVLSAMPPSCRVNNT